MKTTNYAIGQILTNANEDFFIEVTKVTGNKFTAKVHADFDAPHRKGHNIAGFQMIGFYNSSFKEIPHWV